jgi:hypothetical protein
MGTYILSSEDFRGIDQMTDTSAVDPLGAAIDERFELLSAYLDGEATTQERQQVEALLAEDAEFQKLYRQLKQIHSGIPHIPVPTSQSLDALTEGVFAKIDKRRHRRFAWVGGAIAAGAALGMGLTTILDGNNRQFQFAQTGSNPDRVANILAKDVPAPLVLALNDPILPELEEDMAVPMTTPEVQIDEVQ